MKLSKIAFFLKNLIQDFWISLKWNEIIEFNVRSRNITESRQKKTAYSRPNLKIREASLAEIKYLASKRRQEFFDYQERLKLNHKCLIAKWKGSKEISGYIWVAINNYRFPETILKIQLKEDEAYICNAYIFPKFRGQGIFPLLAIAAAELLLPLNYKRVYALVSKTNPAMTKIAMPKYDKIGLRFFKYLKPIRARLRTPFLQKLYNLYYLIRYFKGNYGMKYKGKTSS